MLDKDAYSAVYKWGQRHCPKSMSKSHTSKKTFWDLMMKYNEIPTSVEATDDLRDILRIIYILKHDDKQYPIACVAMVKLFARGGKIDI